jgi:hypothetical protein
LGGSSTGRKPTEKKGDATKSIKINIKRGLHILWTVTYVNIKKLIPHPVKVTQKR